MRRAPVCRHSIWRWLPNARGDGLASIVLSLMQTYSFYRASAESSETPEFLNRRPNVAPDGEEADDRKRAKACGGIIWSIHVPEGLQSRSIAAQATPFRMLRAMG